MDAFVQFLRDQKVVGIAVGFALGVALVDMLNRVLSALVTPIVERIAGEPSISQSFTVEIGDSALRFGDALDAVVQFLIIAFVIYVMVRALGTNK